MTSRNRRVAILFPADSSLKLATSLENSRHAATAKALGEAGLDVVGAPFADDLVDAVRERLLGVDGVLVWFNPTEGGSDRSVLNAMLRDVASKGVVVSAHPDVIDRIGTKEVLHRTRSMGWGCDTRLYTSVDMMRLQLAASLNARAPRVLKQIRGQSGDGIWQVALAERGSAATAGSATNPLLRVRHAKRGSPEELLTLEAFLDRCGDYFPAGGGMIDQEYQSRLPEGMVRCYLVHDRVAGFGEQLVNMLYPAPPGAPASEAPLPGPRLYYPPTRPDFQALKDKLEREWVDELCRIAGLEKSQLPVLWDADFLYGPKDSSGADTYVLCEINVSSVYPFPETALAPLVANTLARIERRHVP
jgi:hypothetical protein